MPELALADGIIIWNWKSSLENIVALGALITPGWSQLGIAHFKIKPN